MLRRLQACALFSISASFLALMLFQTCALSQTAAPGIISKVPTGEYGAYDGTWSADGMNAIFVSDKGGDPAVYKVPAPAGGSVTTVTLVSNSRADMWPDVNRKPTR